MLAQSSNRHEGGGLREPRQGSNWKTASQPGLLLVTTNLRPSGLNRIRTIDAAQVHPFGILVITTSRVPMSQIWNAHPRQVVEASQRPSEERSASRTAFRFENWAVILPLLVSYIAKYFHG